jgi:glutathione S-transferase
VTRISSLERTVDYTAAMPSYKLTYFNLRGKGEICRLIFAAAGVPYEDVRVDRPQWLELKPTTPFGQIPVLEVEGVKLCQSKAIARYLAGEFGFAGETALDRARVDMIVDCVEDVMKPALTFFFEQDEIKKVELKDKFVKETLPTNLQSFEKLLKENKGGDSYFVGDKMTWADISFIDLCARMGSFQVEMPFGDFPKLKALRERVESTPKIAEWIKKRPVTER